MGINGIEKSGARTYSWWPGNKGASMPVIRRLNNNQLFPTACHYSFPRVFVFEPNLDDGPRWVLCATSVVASTLDPSWTCAYGVPEHHP